MQHMLQVIAMMTPFPYSIDRDQTAAEARTMMAARGFRHLRVTSAGKICGILSDRDLRTALGGGASAFRRRHPGPTLPNNFNLTPARIPV